MDTPPVRTSDRDRTRWLPIRYRWLGVVALLAAAIACYWALPAHRSQLAYGELLERLEDPRITFRNVEVTPTEITGQLVRPDGTEVSFVTGRLGLQNDPELVPLLRKKTGGHFTGQVEESGWVRAGLALVPPLATLGLLGLGVFWAFRKLGTGMMGFGRNRGLVAPAERLHVTFQHVAGIEEAVEELREVVDFLKQPQKYQALGGRIPRGVLLVGPPGTGKTLLARAVAGEAGAPFFSLSGSDFVEMFVGVGAARVRDLFARAAKCAPCIIFIDELDALGKARGGRPGGSHEEREQTLNQLLVEMDGFDSNRGVIVVAATNRPETLDPALLRPGRFDRTVVVDRPDVRGRRAILEVHARRVKLAATVDLASVAALTPGCVGADLANIINEAALLAARRGRAEVHRADLEEAVERGAAGLERKQRLMRPAEKERVAFHETGHALVACLLPGADPVHKVSIIPRGLAALGYTMQRPADDRYLTTRSELFNQIKVLLGGTLAEELVCGEVSTGAQNDLERASRLARGMVKQFGMSRLGRVNFQDQGTSAFLAGPSTPGDRDYSERTARQIDREVARIIRGAAAEVRALLTERRAALEAIARRLMEAEVLDGSELYAFLLQGLTDTEDSSAPDIAPAALSSQGRVIPTPSSGGLSHGDVQSQ